VESHLTNRWRIGEAVAEGRMTNEQAEKMATNPMSEGVKGQRGTMKRG